MLSELSPRFYVVNSRCLRLKTACKIVKTLAIVSSALMLVALGTSIYITVPGAVSALKECAANELVVQLQLDALWALPAHLVPVGSQPLRFCAQYAGRGGYMHAHAAAWLS